MRNAPHVNRGEAAENANMNRRRLGARAIATPLAPSTEDGDPRNVDVDTFRYVHIYVAEADEHGQGGFRMVDFGLPKIQVEISEDRNRERATMKPEPTA